MVIQHHLVLGKFIIYSRSPKLVYFEQDANGGLEVNDIGNGVSFGWRYPYNIANSTEKEVPLPVEKKVNS